MPNTLLSEALREAYASAPSDVVILHTLELRHPSFLDDDGQHNDIRTLRDLAGSIKIMQRTFLQTLVRWVTVGFLALLVAGIAAKGGMFHR